MRGFILAIKRRFAVQSKRKHNKTKMNQIKMHLDGSEKSMIPILKNNADRLSLKYKNKIISLEEFSAGTGISDLTVFTLDKKILSERKNSNRRPATSQSQIE